MNEGLKGLERHEDEGKFWGKTLGFHKTFLNLCSEDEQRLTGLGWNEGE